MKFLTARFNRLASVALTASIAALLLVSTPSSATPYVVKLVQHANNVTASGNGSFDLTGLTLYAQFGAGPFAIQANTAEINLGATGTVIDGYYGLTGPTTFGSGGAIVATTGTGDTVDFLGSDYPGIGFAFLWVPTGYTSGTALSSSAVWDSATFASLGVTPGTYVWTWGTEAEQSFTLDIVTAVPEPGALGMVGLGLLLIGCYVGLRRRVA